MKLTIEVDEAELETLLAALSFWRETKLLEQSAQEREPVYIYKGHPLEGGIEGEIVRAGDLMGKLTSESIRSGDE